MAISTETAKSVGCFQKHRPKTFIISTSNSQHSSMSLSNRFLLAASVLLATIGGAYAYRQSVGPLSPAVPEVTGLSTPSWYDTQDIGGGVTLETSVSFLETVTDPNTGGLARPMVITTSASYGLSLLDNSVYLDFFALGDATPYTLGATIDRNLAVRQSPPFDVLNFDISVTPKVGYTWDTVRGVNDMDIVAIERP